MKIKDTRLALDYGKTAISRLKSRKNGNANKLDSEDRRFHDWYRFVLSFPPHLVRDYFQAFSLTSSNTILDPFCGTGTTLVEAKLHKAESFGLEANAFAHFAASVKIDWDLDAGMLVERANEVAYTAAAFLRLQGLDDKKLLEEIPDRLKLQTLDPQLSKLLLANSISPLPLHKTLVLLDTLKPLKEQTFYRHAVLALANALVYKISNLRFGPEVGVGKPKVDAPVIDAWLSEIEKMADDLRVVQGGKFADSRAIFGDAREIHSHLKPNSIDAVITSPPYPNEKDYTRTTRLESVLLGFINSKAELRAMKGNLVRSNTRNVYKTDDDDRWVAEHEEIQRLAKEIERRRIELEKDSGFERLYGRVTKLYFGGMARHLGDLRSCLRPGAKLAYVVGDQASYLRVMIRTGQLLAEIASELGYKVERIDLFRTRLATATKEQLREEVVILTWPGG